MGKTASLSRPYLHEGMVLHFLQYGGMDRESEAVFRMRIDARNGANADDLCRWLHCFPDKAIDALDEAGSRAHKNPDAIRGIKEILLTNIAKKA